MNKEYQKALDDMCTGCYGRDDGCNGKDIYCSRFLTLQQLVDKATPKKVKIVKENDKFVGKIESYRCPTCSYHELFIKFTDINMVGKYKSNYCEVCGQHLDWSNENEMD